MVYTISTGFAIYFVMWWIVLFLHPKDFSGALVEIEQA